MAQADMASKPQVSDKSSKARLFAWMKRLKPKKDSAKKRNGSPSPAKSDRRPFEQETPEDQSYTNGDRTNNDALAAEQRDPYYSRQQTNDSFHSFPPPSEELQTPNDGLRPKSTAPTLDTNPGTTHSDGVLTDGDRHSKAGTSGTMTGGMSSASGGGGASIFSSPNHSARSLSTTLTTIQSQPSNTGNGTQQPNGLAQHSHHNASHHHSNQPSQSSAYFSHQYPTTPASAVPAHLNPTMHLPTTYRSATANNLLTDNASMLTLASSSHRPHRRNSLDTNASIRAIAPSSVWGGSRESLPLSILSQNADGPAHTASHTPPSTAQLGGSSGPRSISGLERTSVYSAGGVGAPALSSERNSIYAGRTKGEDGHSRNDSVTTS